MNNVGLHVGGSYEDIIDIPELYERGFRTFQIFFGCPKNYSLPRPEAVRTLLEKVPDSINLIAHGPYVISLVTYADSRHWRGSLNHVLKATRMCESLGIKYYVTHIGSIRQGQDKRSGYFNLISFCNKWLQLTRDMDVVLCLENSPGSKSGRKIGSIPLVYKVVELVDHPRVRMCFDSEHAYANGFNIEDEENIDKLAEVSDILHLNAVPEKVEKGKHLDRHSFTPLNESMTEPEVLINIAKRFLDKPIIFERRDYDISESDYHYLKEKLF